MPYTPSVGTNDAFMAGHTPLANSGRGNDNSVTLGQAAGDADQGLDAMSQHWNSMTPHGVLSQASTGQDDGAYELLQRDQGGYQPGSMPAMQDELSGGSDDQP